MAIANKNQIDYKIDLNIVVRDQNGTLTQRKINQVMDTVCFVPFDQSNGTPLMHFVEYQIGLTEGEILVDHLIAPCVFPLNEPIITRSFSMEEITLTKIPRALKKTPNMIVRVSDDDQVISESRLYYWRSKQLKKERLYTGDFIFQSTPEEILNLDIINDRNEIILKTKCKFIEHDTVEILEVSAIEDIRTKKVSSFKTWN